MKTSWFYFVCLCYTTVLLPMDAFNSLCFLIGIAWKKISFSLDSSDTCSSNSRNCFLIFFLPLHAFDIQTPWCLFHLYFLLHGFQALLSGWIIFISLQTISAFSGSVYFDQRYATFHCLSIHLFEILPVAFDALMFVKKRFLFQALEGFFKHHIFLTLVNFWF